MSSTQRTRKRAGRIPATLPKLCISATGRSLSELMSCARTALSQSQFIELRLDMLPQPSAALPHIAGLLSAAPGAIIQATCRRKPNGGEFAGDVREQLAILTAAIQAGCRLVDLEIETAEQVPAEAVKELSASAGLIVSFHDFHKTPPLSPIVRRLQKIPADIYKLVPTATGQSDVVRLLEQLQQLAGEAQARWVGFCMGDAGVPSRILALSRGSAFIYAAPAAGDGAPPAAPGQLNAELLRRRYRADKITPQTRIYGVLGNPVKHSIGTSVHNNSLASLGVDAVYLPLQSADVREFRQAALRYPLDGFSITLPHKQAILRYVDKVDSLVKAVGAANTVRSRGGKWEAINSDVAGIVDPLRKCFKLGDKDRFAAEFKAVVLGNGGAARAAIAGLQSLGCRQIAIAGRNPQKTGKLAKEFKCQAIAMQELASHKADLLIQATSVGMWPNKDDSPLTPMQICAEVVFDLVYNPQETRLLQMARAKGCQTISGIEMYLAQAARQFEYWTGKKAPLLKMRRSALDALELMRHNEPR